MEKVFKFILCIAVCVAIFHSSISLQTDWDCVVKASEVNLVALDKLVHEVEGLKATSYYVEEERDKLLIIVSSQQRHMDGQRKVIDRLIESTKDAKQQLKNAHKVNIAQQQSLRNYEKIIDEASKTILELRQKVEDLKKY